MGVVYPAASVTAEARAFPTQETAQELHRRLLEGDAVAPSDVASGYLEPLAQWLKRLYPGVDESQCDTAAEDAILAYIKRPHSYDAGRAPLDRYLCMAARRDLQNLRKAEFRHQARQADWGAVELSGSMRKYLIDDRSDPAHIAELQEMVHDIIRKRPRLTPAATHGLSHGEVEALALVECGERRTELYAVVLGLTGLPLDEQRAQVKRVKDRLKVRLRRAGAADA